MKKALAIMVVLLGAAGLWFATRSGPERSLAPEGVRTTGSEDSPARVRPGTTSAGSAATAPPLYRPPRRTDRTSVAGDDLRPLEGAKPKPSEPISTVAQEAAEAEKERRRKEARDRKEARAEGFDVSGERRGETSPGAVQKAAQEAEDEDPEASD